MDSQGDGVIWIYQGRFTLSAWTWPYLILTYSIERVAFYSHNVSVTGLSVKDPNVSQYLNYVRSYACLQEQKKDSWPQRPWCWVQNPRWWWKNVCKKDHEQNGRMQQKNYNGCPKEFNHSMLPQHINIEDSSPPPIRDRVLFEHSLDFSILWSENKVSTKLCLVPLAQMALGRRTLV